MGTAKNTGIDGKHRRTAAKSAAAAFHRAATDNLCPTSTSQSNHEAYYESDSSSQDLQSLPAWLLEADSTDDDSSVAAVPSADPQGAGVGFAAGGDLGERLWAQCDACRKWRQLPKHVSATQLPAKWYCKMNATDDTQHGSCDDPEEPFAEQRSPAVPQSEPLHLRRRVETREATLRTFCGSWARRLALEEHASARNSAQESGGRAGGMMWVQCSACSKWRYIWCNATTAAAERWFCVQNTYDESMASCSAPQETALDAMFLQRAVSDG